MGRARRSCSTGWPAIGAQLESSWCARGPTGLPISGLAWHVTRAAQNFRMFAEVASTLAGETYSQARNYLTYVTREPKGVAALIAP